MKQISLVFLLFFSFMYSSTEDNSKNEIVGYLDNNLPITKADMEWRSTVRSGKQMDDWGKVVTMPENCDSSLQNKLYNIANISTNVLNKNPKEWLTGKYLEFVNSQCRLSMDSFEYKYKKFIAEEKGYDFFGDFMTILFWALFIGYIAWGSNYYPKGLIYRNWYYKMK